MAKKLFITATGTDIGKTYAACKILERLGGQGGKIGAVKPVETGVKDTPQDAVKLLKICQKYNPEFANLTSNDITAYTFKLPAAPFSADTKNIIEIPKILAKIEQIEKLCDFLIIEGAGGLFVPIKKNYFMIDLIKEINCQTLLVTPSRLGCINETMLSLNALKKAGIPHNWCVNLFEDKEAFAKTTKPFYDAYFKEWFTLEEIDCLKLF